ncbi:MAG: 30S ribosomal protein S17 [Candidatus Peregrinibacteria bacterium]|nr:30S ribosomal protein S17 [Candidatus Peregrinibacteria bacterium]
MRVKKGTVSSNKQTKTLVVVVNTYKNHPKYKKRFLVSKKFHVHNPEDTKFELGTEVTFYETRPLSKLKKWTLEKPVAKETTKVTK